VLKKRYLLAKKTLSIDNFGIVHISRIVVIIMGLLLLFLLMVLN